MFEILYTSLEMMQYGIRMMTYELRHTSTTVSMATVAIQGAQAIKVAVSKIITYNRLYLFNQTLD